MSNRPGRTRDEGTHRAIIEAAREVLEEHGYAGFAIERVAARAGAGKPTIYRWWPSRTALLIEVFDDATTDSLIIADVGSTNEQVRQWFERVWAMWTSTVTGAAFRSIVAEIQSDEAALGYFNTHFVEHRRELLLVVLRRACDRGELSTNSIETIVDCCWGYNWYHLLTGRTPSARDLDQVVAALIPAGNYEPPG